MAGLVAATVVTSVASPPAAAFSSRPAALSTAAEIAAGVSSEGRLVRYRGPVEHIFFHPLMPYPRFTLHRGTQQDGFNQFMVTVREFRRMLPQIYANDWVLVDINSLVKVKRTARGKVLKPAPLMLPPGKKPLVISIDDLNYPQYMIDNRLNSKLVLDDKGNVAAERVRPGGGRAVSRRTEIVPMLDKFVEAHPDFSPHGAKGVIALTGFDGILGYRTSGDRAIHRARARRNAAPVVERLKETGWSFASHSYGHPDMAKASMAYLKRDTDKWERNVEPLLDPVRVYMYPFGSPVAYGSEKFRYLRSVGFRIFCGISPAARLVVEPTYAIQDRVHVDGISLLSQQNILTRFFNARSVVDPVRPPL